MPAPEGAYLGQDKAMVISCEHWDAQIGDHIGKSCGEGVYHELQVIGDPTRIATWAGMRLAARVH